jgi:hypothetical protein
MTINRQETLRIDAETGSCDFADPTLRRSPSSSIPSNRQPFTQDGPEWGPSASSLNNCYNRYHRGGSSHLSRINYR